MEIAVKAIAAGMRKKPKEIEYELGIVDKKTKRFEIIRDTKKYQPQEANKKKKKKENEDVD